MFSYIHMCNKRRKEKSTQTRITAAKNGTSTFHCSDAVKKTQRDQ